MSFSSDVKDELSKHIPPQRHCQIAELAAIIVMCGDILISSEDKYCIRVTTENLAVSRKYFTLLKKTFNISTEISVKYNMNVRKSRQYTVYVREHEAAVRILQAVKLLDDDNGICEDVSLISNLVVTQPCCKRAFIRGAFLAAGSISDPNKAYHFEIVCQSKEKAVQLMNIINAFEQDAKVVERKKHFVTYLKEGAQIVDVLNIMEAHIALMDLENVRIVKEVRNQINREVNCEAANLNKTIKAALKQIEDIEYIRDTIGLNKLNPALREVAQLRLDNPEASLKEICEMMSEMVGKSGVNHRFKKISEIAEGLKTGGNR